RFRRESCGFFALSWRSARRKLRPNRKGSDMRANTIRVRRAFRRLAISGSFALAAATAGCADLPASGGGSTDEMTGRAELALSGVPADGTCVQVVAAGNR